MTDIFRSTRLTYRAVDLKTDLSFFESIQADKLGYQNSNASNIRLPNTEDARDSMHGVSEALLGAIIRTCPSANDGSSAVDIGQLSLQVLGRSQSHHRNCELGIEILPDWQGKGYGTEAISWALEYAFYRMDLHRVEVWASGWNERAINLYRKLGFKEEGRKREALWHDGKWWDDVVLGILATEWADIQRKEL